MSWVHKILPWAPRAQRRAAIAAARQQKEQAGRDLEHAREVQRQIRREVYGRNNYAQLIADQITGRQDG